MLEEVKQALESVRPHMQADGGDIELVEVDEQAGIVKVRLVGACGGCPMSQFTLANGVARVLREQVPGVKQVLPI